VGHEARWEYYRVIYERYRKAEGKAKRVMLDEFCLNTGYHRKYAIRLLNGPPPGKRVEARPRGRKPRYGQQVVSLLAWPFAPLAMPRNNEPKIVPEAPPTSLMSAKPMVLRYSSIELSGVRLTFSNPMRNPLAIPNPWSPSPRWESSCERCSFSLEMAAVTLPRIVLNCSPLTLSSGIFKIPFYLQTLK